MKKFLTSLLIGMVVLILGVTILVTRSLKPLAQAEAATIDVAERRADLVAADEFYWYNGNETYFTITGKNSADEAIVVIVQQNGGAIEVFQQSEIISRKEALAIIYELENPARILEARIGIHEGQAIWEVSFRQENGRLGYSMLSLTSGRWLRTIKNI